MLARPGVFGMKARAQLEQRADAAADADGAARGLDHAGDDLEQRRFAGAVLADDGERFTAPELEADAVERAEHVGGAVAAQQVPDEAQPAAARIDLRVVLADGIESQQ